MATALGDAIQFLKDLGLFDVVLPFLLVFSLVFALLEKTRILGTEKIDGDDVPRRSINTMVAFVIGLLVVATNEVVNIINAALPNVVLLIVAVVMFLMLVGAFYKEGEFNFADQHKGWLLGFMVVLVLLILIVVANSIETESGDTWLEVAWDGISSGGEGVGSAAGAAVIFGVIAIIAIFIVVRKPSTGGEDK
jgi:hypothetical protein